MATDITIECIESILKTQTGSNFHIVVVDNGSNNGSGKLLSEKYKDENRVTIILSEVNLGFAKGNNIGFQYAKEKDARFIYMINNDTYLEQTNCLQIISELYTKYKFHILGPDIYSTKNHIHQNPAKITIQDPKVLKKMIFHHKMRWLLSFFNLDEKLVIWKKKLFNQYEPILKQYENGNHISEQVGVKLHGSALVFSKDYIAKYDGLYPHTFMYSEEAFIYFIAKRDKLTTLYHPALKIFHNEDQSTEMQYGKSMRKRRFYYKNYVASGNKLYSLMTSNK